MFDNDANLLLIDPGESVEYRSTKSFLPKHIRHIFPSKKPILHSIVSIKHKNSDSERELVIRNGNYNI